MRTSRFNHLIIIVENKFAVILFWKIDHKLLNIVSIFILRAIINCVLPLLNGLWGNPLSIAVCITRYLNNPITGTQSK